MIIDVKKNVSLENMKYRSINEDESFYKKENVNFFIGFINYEVWYSVIRLFMLFIVNNVNGYIFKKVFFYFYIFVEKNGFIIM